MDRVIPRGERPIDRQAASRPQPAYRSHGQPQTVDEAPPTPPTQRVVTQHHGTHESKPKKRPIVLAVFVIIVVVLAFVGWFAWTRVQVNGPTIDSSKYQAVFFTNGQVYFGKLQNVNDEYMRLTDIYYLQTQAAQETDSKNPQKTTPEQSSNVQLIKLGDEIHGPEDMMIISKNQLLFYENLKSDGNVTKTIIENK